MERIREFVRMTLFGVFVNCVLLEDCFCALQQNRKGFLTLPFDAAQALSFRFLSLRVRCGLTHCFPDVTIDKSLRKLAELEYSASEIVIETA